MFQRIISKIKKYNYASKLYFENAVNEITEYNLNMLKTISAVITLLIIFLIMITPLIFYEWHVSAVHIIFVLVTSVFFIITYLYGKKKIISKSTVDTLCLLFCSVVVVFIILIDVLPYNDKTGSFMQIIIAVLPVVFVLKYGIASLFILVVELIYSVILYHYKSIEVFQIDLFNSIVGVLIFLIFERLTINFRVESYIIKNKYMQLSTFDALTGVMNKNNSEREIKKYLNNQKKLDRCSLIIIDIDNYKAVNDRMGHQVGDEVLERVGRLLIHSFDSSDIIGRIGGDEFAILMDNVADKNTLKRKCELLYSKAKSVSDAVNFSVSFSIGVAIQEEADVTFEEMFKSADDALYEAKAFGKGQCIMHGVTKEKHIELDRRIMIVSLKSPISRRRIADEFKQEFEVIETSNSGETLNEISRYNEDISIVFMDLLMPEIDGYQLLRYMKSREILSRIPVIAVTSDENSLNNAEFEYENICIMSQPIDIKKARGLVTRLLNYDIGENYRF